MAQRVMIVGQRFAALRRDRYLTQEEFAARLEMSPANVRRLEQAKTGGMQVKNFRRLATLLNVSPDDLRRQIGAIDVSAAHEGTILEIEPQQPPVTELKLPRGLKPRTLKEVSDVSHYHGVSAARVENRTDTSRGSAPIPAGSSRRFAVTVDGDCMEPKYRDGDVVVFSVDAAEREGIIDGRNYFIQFAGEENTFKRVFLDPQNNELLILRCWNAKYEPRVIERSKVKLLARAIYRMIPDE